MIRSRRLRFLIGSLFFLVAFFGTVPSDSAAQVETTVFEDDFSEGKDVWISDLEGPSGTGRWEQISSREDVGCDEGAVFRSTGGDAHAVYVAGDNTECATGYDFAVRPADTEASFRLDFQEAVLSDVSEVENAEVTFDMMIKSLDEGGFLSGSDEFEVLVDGSPVDLKGVKGTGNPADLPNPISEDTDDLASEYDLPGIFDNDYQNDVYYRFRFEVENPSDVSEIEFRYEASGSNGEYEGPYISRFSIDATVPENDVIIYAGNDEAEGREVSVEGDGVNEDFGGGSGPKDLDSSASWRVQRGTEVEIEAPTPQEDPSQATQYVFDFWGGGDAPSNDVGASFEKTITEQTMLFAHFVAEHELTVEEEGGGTVDITPSSTDGFYEEGTQVELAATANDGYVFDRWTGDGSGSNSTTSVTMDEPREVTAVFEQGPTISPTPSGPIEVGPDGSDEVITIDNGGGGTLNWSASSEAEWIELFTSSGTDGDRINFSVDNNPDTEPRDAEIKVEDSGATNSPVSIDVEQEASAPDPPELAVEPGSRSVGAEGGTVEFDVINEGEQQMSWTASSDADWVEITGGSSGTDNGTVEVTVAGNTSTSSRTAGIIVDAGEAGTETVEVIQEGTDPEPAEIAVSATALDFGTVEVGNSETETVTVENEGESSLEGEVSLAFGSEAFAVNSGDGSYVLGAGETLDVKVEYVPEEVGADEGTLEVAHNADNESDPFVVALEGEGVTDEPAGDPFITTWETTEADETVTIPTNGVEVSPYDFTIDWGDGTTETVMGEDPDPSHTYADAGTYQVEITGTFPRIYIDAHFSGDGDVENAMRLQSIDQWGDTEWEDMTRAFAGAENLTIEATDSPDLSGVLSLSGMFYEAEAMNADLGTWETGGVSDMSNMFRRAEKFNNGGTDGIGSWDVSNVTDMESMFSGAQAFDRNIGGWDVSSVTNTRAMFQDAASFDRDIGGWDVSNVADMSSMFSGAESFDRDIGDWDVSSVGRMDGMFNDAESFDQNLGDWDVSNVQSFETSAFEKGFLEGGELSPDNYDALLQGWVALNLEEDINFHAGASQYSEAAQDARQSIIEEYGWTIEDGGLTEDVEPAIAVSDEILDFGAVEIGSSGTETLSVENEGDSPLEGEVGLASGNDAFTLASGGGNYSLEPGETLEIEVNFTPEEAATFEGAVEVSHNAENRNDPVKIGLEGEATESEIAYGPDHTYAPGDGWEYFITVEEYSVTEDILVLIEEAFGGEAELVDWNTLTDLYADDKDGLVSFMDGIGMKQEEGVYKDNAFVTRGGDRFHSTGSIDRHYYVARHDGDKPGNFLAHDDLHSNLLSLGSWDSDREVLVRRPVSATATIEGTVIGPSEANVPIENMRLVAEGEETYETKTDADGAFSIEVDPGTYELQGDAVNGTTYLSIAAQQTEVSVQEGETETLSLNTQEGYYLDVENAQVGEQDDTTLTVQPGEDVSLRFDYTTWTRSGCSACVVYLAAGIGDEGQSASYIGNPGPSPGEEGGVELTVTAPSVPGRYDVNVFLAPQTSESDALDQYEEEAPDTFQFVPVADLKVQANSITVEPDSLEFETVAIGSTATKAVQIVNEADTNATGSVALQDADGPFSLKAEENEFSVDPGDSSAVEVSYEPESASNLDRDTLEVVPDGANADSSVKIALEGEAEAPEMATQLVPSDTTVGSGEGVSFTQTVVNDAEEVAQLDVSITEVPEFLSLEASSIDGEGSLEPDSLEMVLGPGAEATLTYQFDEAVQETTAFEGVLIHGTNDPERPTVELPVLVTVEAPNAPPVARADSFQVKEDSVLKVGAPGVLENDGDPDGDSLVAELVSGASSGSVSLEGDGSFEYSPESGFTGEEEFIYRAVDDSSAADTATVTVEVLPVNAPPRVLRSLPDRALRTEGPSLKLTNLDGALFRDPDGDELSFSATSSAPSVVEATSEEAGSVFLRPRAAGTAQVTLTASDGEAETSADPFEVVVEEAEPGEEVADEAASGVVSKGDSAEVTLGETGTRARFQSVETGGVVDASFFADVRDGAERSALAESQANFDPEEAFENVSRYRWEMSVRKATFETSKVEFSVDDPDVVGIRAPESVVVILDEEGNGDFVEVETRFVETDSALVASGLTALGTFRLASDSGENSFGNPSRERPDRIGVEIQRPFGSASGPQDYRLVALPGAINRPLSEMIGGDPETDWQAFWDDGSEEDFLREFDGSETFHFQPGRGFWVTSTETWTVSDSVETVPLREDGTTSISLHDGWNIISNPLGQSISWSAVETANDGGLQPAWAFDGSFSQADSFQTAARGEAYYFLNDRGLDSLAVPLPESSPSDGSALASRSGSSEKRSSAETMRLVAQAGDSLRSAVEVGVASEADEESQQVVAPPTRLADLSLRLESPENVPPRRQNLAAEYRRPNTGTVGGYTFDLQLRNETGEPVRLQASGADRLDGKEVALIEKATGESHDLRAQGPVVLEAADSTALLLAVGTSAFVEDQRESTRPDEVTLTSYPNPFRNRATLEYTLPEASDVKIAVYDVLGRRVAVLEDGRKRAGRHSVQLNGARLSSGVYVGRLEVEDQTRTRKITVVR